MKIRFLGAIYCALPCLFVATAQQWPTENPAQPVYSIVERGPHHRVWQTIRHEETAFGRVSHVQQYTELSSGLHYRAATGEWLESSEEIELFPNGSGAAASKGQHKVLFPADIATGEIELNTPDGKWLRSRVMGLSYFDTSSGMSIIIAEATNSIGAIDGNTVWYRGALVGDCSADVRYIYRRSGFEQDIVLRSAPPDPSAFGLNPETTVLQVLTEFVAPPVPNRQQRRWADKKNQAQTDDCLDFGAMKLGVGRAFDINSNPRNQGMRVRKHWLQLEGRDWLFEEMPFDDVRERLARLPTQAGTGPRKPQLRAAALERILPTRRLAGTPANRVMSVAKLEGSRPGFVVDYHAVNSITNFTFKGDTTYYVSGSVMFSGSVVIEGGTVVKFNPISGWGGLFVDNTSIDCQTSEYRPAVFTSMHDNTVGESISGSSGLPSSAPDQNSYLQTTDADQNLQHLRMLYSYTGLTVMYGNGRVSDSQFSHNQYPIYTVNSPKTKFLNVLLNDASQVAVWIYNGKVEIQNGTIHRCNQLFENESGGALAITNTLLAGVTNWGDAYVGSFNATNSGSLVFQTAGAAGHYLPTNSIYRNAGTTNIDATLLGILRTKTTEAPIVYSNISIPTSTVFSPRVSRDEAAPDLGFHYDPIDYAFGGVTAVSNLTFAPGAALAWFELNGSGGAGSGIALGPYGSINLTGTVTSPAVLARYSTVQEGGNGNWTEKGWLAGVTTVANNPSPVDANLRFAKVFALANDPNHFRDYFGTLNVRATHSEFWNASIAGYGAFQYYTNCLLNRVYVGLHCECAFGIVMRNCTMRGGSLVADRWSGAPATQGLSVSDTAFDGTSIVNNSGGLTNTMAAYNAFLTGSNTIVPTSGNNVAVATTYDWQKNWLGNSYLPPASPLINSGSVSNAGLAGLYHFTTQTNQAKDAATRLDIGYHYVAESVQGLRYVPTDTDGDGSADYLEDGNGNGIADMSETSWLLNNYNGLNSVLALEVFTPLK